MKRWLTEPLLHFLLLGFAIFGAYRLLGPDEQPPSSIVVTEGMALGLDRDDTVIRRRLKQKLEFVAEAAGIAAEPTDGDLRTYLEQHRGAYRTDARLSFVHAFLSTETSA